MPAAGIIITTNRPITMAMPTDGSRPMAVGIDASLLHLMRLVSPSLPIGSFAYSQGLEAAVEQGWVDDEASAAQWIGGVLGHAITALEVPVLMHLHRAWQAQALTQVNHWNRFLLASRESAELREEDRLLGAALLRLLCDLGLDAALQWREETRETALCTMFALAAVHWQVPAAAAAAGFCWSWSENQVAAAIKLIPLGQTAGQRILFTLADRIPALCEQGAALEETAIGQAAPGVAMAGALHEIQYSRLFRS